MANDKTDQTPAPAEENVGTPDTSFAAAIEAEHDMMISLAHPGVVPYAGVPTWAPGDRVARSHPGFGQLLAEGLLVPSPGAGA
jgi:hypothetical protein